MSEAAMSWGAGASKIDAGDGGGNEAARSARPNEGVALVGIAALAGGTNAKCRAASAGSGIAGQSMTTRKPIQPPRTAPRKRNGRP
ncbi:hypothetical protein, partial [Staphylococcus aureus]